MTKKPKIGINGFGRVGRTVLRVNKFRDLFDVVAINDINDDIENLAYLMKYDSIHGTLQDDIEVVGNEILCRDFRIKVFSERKIEKVPWNDLGVDVVVGCTGNLENVEHAKKCLGESVKKVVFSDSPVNVDFTFVFGVNENEYDHRKHNIVACSICDVVGLGPALVKIEERYGIQYGFLLTLHPWLFYQNIMDGKPKSVAFMDKPWTHHAIGRASVGTLIPKNTSLVPALERVMPSIKGKLEGMSFRIPTEVVASANVSLMLEKDAETQEVKDFLSSCCRKPVMGYTEEPMISVDYKYNDYSCIVDGKWIEVLHKRLLRMVTWYDNEWGYSSRLIDIIQYILEKPYQHN